MAPAGRRPIDPLTFSLVPVQIDAVPPVTPEILFVFGLVALALILFATEPVPVDVTAIGILVTLLLVDPVTAELAAAGALRGGLDLLADPLGDGLAGVASSAP
ncbi:MAG: di/tricarboxylate transporter [Halobacteriales archaeon]